MRTACLVHILHPVNQTRYTAFEYTHAYRAPVWSTEHAHTTLILSLETKLETSKFSCHDHI